MSVNWFLDYRPETPSESIALNRGYAEAFKRVFDIEDHEEVTLDFDNEKLQILAKAYPEGNPFDQLLAVIVERGPLIVKIGSF